MPSEVTATNRRTPPGDILIATGLFAVVFAAFFPAVHLGFTTYDDPEYVTDNAYVRAGLAWKSIQWAFAAHGANSHPLTWLSHMLDGQLFGLNPWGYHLGNIILHAGNAGLAFLVLNALTGAKPRSAVAAVLFGLHPLRVESVAWIAERKDALSTFFFFLTLLAYVRFVKLSGMNLQDRTCKKSKPHVYYFLALIFFALGLMSKSMVVTLPCVLLLLDFWPLKRIDRTNLQPVIFEKFPFFLLAAAMSVVAWLAQYHGTALVSDLPLSLRLENALISYARYLGKIFWPAGLSPIYPYPHAWPLAMVCASALLLAIISVLTTWQYRQRPYLTVGWFWFLGTLVPVIGIVQVGNQSIADRYTYIPSLGIIMAIVWLAADVMRSWRMQNTLAPASAAGLAIVCFGLTQAQIPYWRNSETLFRRAVDVTSNNTLALIGLGDCLAQRGQRDASIELYKKAIAVSPKYYEAHNSLGLAFLQKNEAANSITEFTSAIACRPGAVEAHINLAVALARSGKSDAAVAELETVVAVNPSNSLAHADLGGLYFQRKRIPEAIRELKSALATDESNVQTHANLGGAYLDNGQVVEAIAEFRRASSLAPDDAEIHDYLGTALAINGQKNDAIAEFKSALALRPGFERAQQNLAKALNMSDK